MSPRHGFAGRLRLVTLSSALVLAAVAGSAALSRASDADRAGRDGLAGNVRIADPQRAAAVRRALLGAFDSLGSAKCQAVFSDFRDASGRTLQAKLDGLGETGQSYLRLVLFYDGSGERGCRSSRQEVSAVTAPGSRAVFVCPAISAPGRPPRPFHPEAVIIHEVLHSLGLGENPPTSEEITWRVFSRCG